MIYRCMKKCMESDEPCEYSYEKMEKLVSKSTPCPIGNDDYFEMVDDENEFFCMIVGTRTYNNYEQFIYVVNRMLSQVQDKKIVIVSGGAKGADMLAERYAKENKYDLIVFKADWEMKGNRAGYYRNKEMHKYIAKKKCKGVIAFWDGISRGTEHSFKLARTLCNPIKVFMYNENKFKKE